MLLDILSNVQQRLSRHAIIPFNSVVLRPMRHGALLSLLYLSPHPGFIFYACSPFVFVYSQLFHPQLSSCLFLTPRTFFTNFHLSLRTAMFIFKLAVLHFPTAFRYDCLTPLFVVDFCRCILSLHIATAFCRCCLSLLFAVAVWPCFVSLFLVVCFVSFLFVFAFYPQFLLLLFVVTFYVRFLSVPLIVHFSHGLSTTCWHGFSHPQLAADISNSGQQSWEDEVDKQRKRASKADSVDKTVEALMDWQENDDDATGKEPQGTGWAVGAMLLQVQWLCHVSFARLALCE